MFKPLKKVFQSVKQVYKGIFASADIFDGLRDQSVTKTRTHAGSRIMFTRRRTPIPAKSTFEGEDTWGHTRQIIDLELPNVS
jgi:hypothetical protein